MRGALRSGIGLTMTGRSEQDSQGSPIRAQEALKAAHFSVGGWLKLALSIHPSTDIGRRRRQPHPGTSELGRTPPNLSVGADPAVAPDAATAFLESDFDSESSQPPDVRREV